MFALVRQPLTRDDNMRSARSTANPLRAVAEEIIKPNDRLTSFERLKFTTANIGSESSLRCRKISPACARSSASKRFDKMAVEYLYECPSQSFTLRNLGARLEVWLRKHPEHIAEKRADRARHGAPGVGRDRGFRQRRIPQTHTEDLLALGDDPLFRCALYRLLALDYPVDELLLSLKHPGDEDTKIASNAVTEKTHAEQLRHSRSTPPRKAYVAVRRADSSFFKRLEPKAHALLTAFSEGQPLSQALERSVDYSNSSIEHVAGELRSVVGDWSSLGWFSEPENAGFKPNLLHKERP